MITHFKAKACNESYIYLYLLYGVNFLSEELLQAVYMFPAWLINFKNLWVNIYADVIHDVTVMFMFVMLIARVYNCQWHEWI